MLGDDTGIKYEWIQKGDKSVNHRDTNKSYKDT